MPVPEPKRNGVKHDESKYASIFRSNPAAIAVFSEMDNQIIEVNAAFCRLSGYTVQELTGITAESLGIWPRPLTAAGEFELRTKQGERRRISASIVSIDLSGVPCRILALQDCTDRRREEDQLRAMNTRLQDWVAELERRTAEIAQLGLMTDLLQSCLSTEEAYQVIAHFSHRTFPTSSGALFMRTQNSMELVAQWGDVAAGEGGFEADQCWALRRGRPHEMDVNDTGMLCEHVHSLRTHPEAMRMGVFSCEAWMCFPLMAKSEALGVYHLCGPRKEILGSRTLAGAVAEHSALALGNLQLRETLRRQSIRDPLTGLFNRRYMEESLERELRRAARNQRTLGAIMIDMDHFKRFNDSFGHDAGDTLLKALGALLQESSRKDDIACRYGGEEFTLILPEASIEATSQRAEHLRQRVKNLSLEYRGQSLGQVTLSLGVAAFPQHGLTSDGLLRAADSALYQAKREGRDRVVVSPSA
jgi:diguanylate cyclase (GGDEF)-like protein